MGGRSWGRSLQAKYFVPWCCNRDSLKFDMQNDHVLKKWNLKLLTPSLGSVRGGVRSLWEKSIMLLH